MTKILSGTEIISGLLKINALRINVDEPFTFASGIKSPIYCDCRLIISDPVFRKQVAFSLAEKIKEKFPEIEVVCGVATGSIAIAAWVAEILDLPMIYTRKPKGYGQNKNYEGKLEENKKVVVIEDTVSTGGSCLEAVRQLQSQKADVLGVGFIYSHELQDGLNNFASSNTDFTKLAGFGDLIQHLQAENYPEQTIQILQKWQKDPQNFIVQ